MSGYWSKSLCSNGGGSLSAQISGGVGRRPPTNVDVRKVVPGVVCVILRLAVLVQYRRVTDGRMDTRRRLILALA